MESNPFSTIQFELQGEGKIAILSLNRPKVYNALNMDLMNELTEVFRALAGVHCSRIDPQAASQVRVLVIRSTTPKAFCAGADLTDQRLLGWPAGYEKETLPSSPGEAISVWMQRGWNVMTEALYHCPVPTIALVEGICAGGGLGLALACDLVVAVDNSTVFRCAFAPELGLIPDLGTTWSLPRRIGYTRALRMSMTGENINAQTASEWGLCSHLFSANSQLQQTLELASTLASSPTHALIAVRYAIERGASGGVAAGRSPTEKVFSPEFSQHLDFERHFQSVLADRPYFVQSLAYFANRKKGGKGQQRDIPDRDPDALTALQAKL